MKQKKLIIVDEIYHQKNTDKINKIKTIKKDTMFNFEYWDYIMFKENHDLNRLITELNDILDE